MGWILINFLLTCFRSFCCALSTFISLRLYLCCPTKKQHISRLTVWPLGEAWHPPWETLWKQEVIRRTSTTRLKFLFCLPPLKNSLVLNANYLTCESAACIRIRKWNTPSYFYFFAFHVSRRVPAVSLFFWACPKLSDVSRGYGFK